MPQRTGADLQSPWMGAEGELCAGTFICCSDGSKVEQRHHIDWAEQHLPASRYPDAAEDRRRYPEDESPRKPPRELRGRGHSFFEVASFSLMGHGW